MVEITSPERVLIEPLGFTKRDLVAYYDAVAGAIVPHLAGRPLTLARFPDGFAGRGFLQNECRGAPEWMRTLTLELRTGQRRRYCIVDTPEALRWVANLSTFELHPYPVNAERPDEAVAMLLDLDPGKGTTIADCCRVALVLRELLEVPARVKTSGGSGLHVEVPLSPGHSFERVRAVARGLAAELHRRLPGLVAEPAARARVPGRVLVDWNQNAPRRSTVAPYSLRAAIPLRVSTPLAWDELSGPLEFGPGDVIERLARLGDLWTAEPQALTHRKIY